MMFLFLFIILVRIITPDGQCQVGLSPLPWSEIIPCDARVVLGVSNKELITG